MRSPAISFGFPARSATSFLGLRARGGAYPELPAEHRAALIARFQVPDPRVELGPRLAGIAHAMIDVSDGLLADLGSYLRDLARRRGRRAGTAAAVARSAAPRRRRSRHPCAPCRRR